MIIRQASTQDIDAVNAIYDAIHTAEEAGLQTIGWIRGVYPTRATATDALQRGDLFVLEDAHAICGAGIINQIQVDVYRQAQWACDAPDDRVCVLHTLVIAPDRAGHGYGRSFLAFYEQFAAQHGCTELRIDTNIKNAAARSMYRKHGYTEIGVMPTVFNGIPNVQLVLLEKHIEI